MKNKDNFCIKCGERPVHVKKRGLCRICYARFYYKSVRSNHPLIDSRIYYSSEIEFIKNFFNHQNWIYHPAVFRLNGINYEPDFYDGERNVFIEVAGTRQAFHRNLEKYKLFKETFPHINFEIRNKQGHIKSLTKGKYERKSQQKEVEVLQTA